MKCEECKVNEVIQECDICPACAPYEAQRDGAMCENCNDLISVSLSPYGNSFMAVISCPTCGESYDTNLTDEEINYLRQESIK